MAFLLLPFSLSYVDTEILERTSVSRLLLFLQCPIFFVFPFFMFLHALEEMIPPLLRAFAFSFFSFLLLVFPAGNRTSKLVFSRLLVFARFERCLFLFFFFSIYHRQKDRKTDVLCVFLFFIFLQLQLMFSSRICVDVVSMVMCVCRGCW